MGDGRTYANLVAVRAITSEDGMTADWAGLPHELLERISSRIVNEVARRQPRRVRHHDQAARNGRVGIGDAYPRRRKWRARRRAFVAARADRRRVTPSLRRPAMPARRRAGRIGRLRATDGKSLAQRCLDARIDLAVLGPETAIAAGVGDRLRDAGIAVVRAESLGRTARVEQDLRETIHGAARNPDGARGRGALVGAARTKRSRIGRARSS